MEETISRKHEEISSLAEMNGEKEARLGALDRHVKELAQALGRVEAQCEQELAAKLRAERQRRELGAALDELTARMQGACDATAMQAELNVKYERDLREVRREMELGGQQHQRAMASAIKRGQEVVEGLVGEVELLQKERAK